MILEVFGFWVLFAVIIFIIAEFTDKKKILGVLVVLILWMLGFWVLTDGIQIYTGTATTGTNTILSNSTFNATINETITNSTTLLNETKTNQYQDITVPYGDFNWVMWIILIGLGIYGFGYYILGVNFLK